MDAKSFEVSGSVPFLAAVSACVDKSGTRAKGRLEAGAIALYTEYNYAEYVGGGVLFY
jgi:hypothetical protein